MHYFIDTFGSKGLSSFEMPYRMKKLYGYPQAAMREIASKLAEKAKEKNIEADIIHCFLNNGVKGIVFDELGCGVINVLPYEEMGVIGSLYGGYAESLRELHVAEEYFVKALKIHDEWEKYYIDNLDFSVLEKKCRQLSDELTDGKYGTGKGVISDRFLGAATAYGAIDYIENITENIGKRYFIKGRPGTGKSTFMRKIANKAIQNGFDVSCYHCAFDPKSIDMVVVKELDVCLFDSTAPHEHFPSRNNDEVIDFYEMASKRNIDREYKAELFEISSEYKEKVSFATDSISKANSLFAKNDAESMKLCDSKNILCIAEVIAAELFG